jgi:hypothetical protein
MTGVCVDEARADTTIATVPVNERQTLFPHLPALLYELIKESSFDDLGGMESVKVNLHVPSPARSLAKHSLSRTDQQNDILT